MFIRNWKQEIRTVPNLLSLLRLALLPVYCHVYLHAQDSRDYLLAGAILALSCLTDLADGFIARRFHQVTRLGMVLDPLADKLTQLTMTACLSLRYPALQPILALLVVKEVFQLALGLLFLKQGRMLRGALPAGKVCTTVLFVSLILLVAVPGLPAGFVKALAAADGVFLTLSLGCYVQAYAGREHLKGLEAEE